MSILMIVELLIVLLALLVGARYGSLALGAISGIGLAILVFVFTLKPSTPPTDVIYIIIAAVTCAGVLQASGGMDWMIQIAEKLLRKNPSRITLYAPFTTFFLTVLVGTGHVVYTLMPIICDIALRKGIRPERPCAISSIAAQIGITCSPIAAAVVAFTAISEAHGFDITNVQVVMVTIPACICGILMAVAYSWNRGLDLDKDPKFQAKLKDPIQYKAIYGESATTLGKEIPKNSKAAVYVFLGALVIVLAISLLKMFGVEVLPAWKGDDGEMHRLSMNLVIQMIMLTAAALMVMFCKAKPVSAMRGSVWQNGMVAVVAIYGIGWMTNTYFDNYKPEMQMMLTDLVSAYPWTIAFAFFFVSVLINSQGAVVVSMLPLAYSLGIEPWILVGVLPSVYGYFFIPNYPSDIATVNFDKSGTTVIGKYLLNHSFMAPGLIHVVTATIVGLAISYVYHFWLGLY